MNYNRIEIGGRITRDIETRHTQGGVVVASFSIATNHKSGDRESVCFLDCVAFNKTADAIIQYFSKGRPIFVYGRLQQESWEDKQTGAKKSKHSMVVDGFCFTDSKSDANGNAQGNQTRGTASQAHQQQPQTSEVDYGDIPF